MPSKCGPETRVSLEKGETSWPARDTRPIETAPARCLLMIADRAEVHAEHLIFLNAKGKLLALILLEIVESWTEVECALTARRDAEE